MNYCRLRIIFLALLLEGTALFAAEAGLPVRQAQAVPQEVKISEKSLVDPANPTLTGPYVKTISDPQLLQNSLPSHDRPHVIQLQPELIQRLGREELIRIVQMQLEKPKSVYEMIFEEDVLTAIVVFSGFSTMIYITALFSYRKRREILDLVHEAIKNGHALPEGIIDTLENKRRPTPEADLRKAVLLIALGLSSTTIIYFIAPAMERGPAAIGVLPTLVGLAYLFLWRLSQTKHG